MSEKSSVKFIVVDGHDGAGKSTLIEHIANEYNATILNKSRHNLADERIFYDINTYTVFNALFKHLKPGIYVLDRFYFSDIVYNKVLNKPEIQHLGNFRTNFKKQYDVLEIILNKEPIVKDFEDELIKLTKAQYNDIVASFKKFTNVDFNDIIVYNKNKNIKIDTVKHAALLRLIHNFIKI